jgi:hypothetical protein
MCWINPLVTILVENLEQPSLDEHVEFRNIESSIQKALAHCNYHLQKGPMEENY